MKVGAGHVAANTIRLLIAGSQAGSLIGISGRKIEKLRNSSGATIAILASTQLPLCASAHESDRVVQVSFVYDFTSKGNCLYKFCFVIIQTATFSCLRNGFI